MTIIAAADNNTSASISVAWLAVIVVGVLLALVVLAAMLASKPNQARFGEYGMTEMSGKIKPTFGWKANAVSPVLAAAQRGRYCPSCGVPHGRCNFVVIALN
jgi:hypothetical protein